MHILNIDLENFKTIEKFAADFTGGIYLVTGENEIGKSTLLGAIGTLLTGQRTDNLLKKGEKKGFAKMTVGEGEESYTVELRVTEKNPRGTLTVEKAGTGLKSSNLTALQSIFKYQDFDAHEFVKWSETAEGRRKQVAVVLSLLPQETQDRLQEIDEEIREIKENRTPVNAEIKAYVNLLDKAGITPDDLKKYKAEKDLKELIQKKADAQSRQDKIEGVKERTAEREKQLEEIPTKEKQIENAYMNTMRRLDEEEDEAKKAYEAAIARIKKNREGAEEILKSENEQLETATKAIKTKIKEAKEWLKKEEKETVDLEELQKQIDGVEEHNTKAKKVKQYQENKKLLDQKKAEKEKMEGQIVTLQDERQLLIDQSDLPIPGLDFTEDGLTLNEVPFRAGEVSTSQEMEVAAKLIIAKNPTVKVFRIAQGESLGKDRLNAIVEFANKNGYQGFIEEVHRGQDELIIEQYTEKS